jgi:hypothetical protein
LGPLPTSTTSGTECFATPISGGARASRASSARHLEHQFVVDLHDHPRRALLVVERLLHRDHRELDQVRRGALHRRVDRLALGRGATRPPH